MATPFDLTPPGGRLTTAPPSFFEPSANGFPIPPGLTAWRLEFDQTNVPAGSTYEFHIEVQRVASWTDATGFTHPAGEWLHTAGGVQSGGQLPSGTFINYIGGAINPNPDNPYPDNVRIRVDNVSHNWIWPRITLIVS